MVASGGHYFVMRGVLMRTSSRAYLDQRSYLADRIEILLSMVKQDPKNIIDAGWVDAGTMAYAAKLVDKAIAEIDASQ